MFLPTLEGQCNEEQRKLFLEPALRHEIIGCYAQTEVNIFGNCEVYCMFIDIFSF